jgi:hypothetical protein
MLEQQARILFMDTDRIVDDRRLPCMIDECSGEVTRTAMSIALRNASRCLLDGAFTAFPKHEFVGEDAESVFTCHGSAFAKSRLPYYSPTSKANFRG